MTALTPAALLTLISTNLADNDAEDITPALHREVLDDLLDSGVNHMYIGSTISGAVTLSTSYFVCLVDTTSANVPLTLPDNASNPNLIFIVKNYAGGNLAQVTPAGTDTVEGSASSTDLSANQVGWFISVGDGNWAKIN